MAFFFIFKVKAMDDRERKRQEGLRKVGAMKKNGSDR